jgi:putative ABC transport system permease protein
MIAAVLRKLAWLARRRRKELELREELDFHLAAETAERQAAGAPDDEARRGARRHLGNVTLVIEDTRAAWGWTALEQAGLDLRYAVRSLMRTPSVTVPAVITLALGIGLTTAMFSVVYGVLLRPLPFPDPDRLVVLHTILNVAGDTEEALSPPNFASLHEESSGVFDAVGGLVVTESTLTGVGEARRLAVARVSAGLFDVLGVRPVLGRTFLPEENQPGQDRVAVISHELWQQQFGGDRSAIDRQVLLNGVSRTVIGVMPRGFDYPSGRAVWVPQTDGRNYFSPASIEGRKNNAFVRVVGRLRPGASLDAAREELRSFAERLEAQFPTTNAGVRFTALPFHSELVGEIRMPLLLLLGAVACVLLIATANVAGLLLARAVSRREEIALRGALGAGRGRIVRQLVTESLTLASAGGVLGLLLAFWATGRIVAIQDAGLRRLGLIDAIRVDGTVLAFAVGITVVTAVVAGLMPAFRAADEGLAGTLQSAGRSGVASPRGRQLRSALVVGQLALAVVLLHGAGLLLHSFVRLTSVDPGFRTGEVVSFPLSLPTATYNTSERGQGFFNDFFAGVRQHPGVISIGAISRLPIGMPGGFRSRFRVEGGKVVETEETSIGARIVTPEYFDTIGVPVRRGRGINARDAAGNLPVVLINEAAAARFFPGEDPLGRRLVNFSYDPIEDAADAFTVIGVVADVRSLGLAAAPHPEAYFAFAQVPLADMAVVIRTAGNPLAHVGAIRAALHAVDPDIPVPQFRTLEQVVADSVDRPRFFTTLVSLFSLVALTLAAVGIFGLLSFAVARRAREMGIRIALGAAPHTLIGTIAREACTLVAIGLGVGLAGALALTQVLENELFDVSPTDPVTLAGVIVTLGITAVVASLVPALRAAAVDPLVAIRAD